jgi:RNA polymerase sigma-70 factor (ECF subfamily)
MTPERGCDLDTEFLLHDAARGSDEAVRILLDRHRARLRRMVALRLDRRLSARLDPSDIVQEALADAARKLADYARDRPLPFYPWLHRLASERLAQEHRRHLRSQARGVGREEPQGFEPLNESAALLADRLIADDPTPATILVRDEQRRRLLEALAEMAETDREVLMMRFHEDLTFPEIAAILEIGEGAAKMRHLRALRRIRDVIGAVGPGSSP